MPQVLKIALPALDSTLHAIGPGKTTGTGGPSTSSGARTRTASFYEIFYPRASYLTEKDTTLGASNVTTLGSTGGFSAWVIPGVYNGTDQRSEETVLNVFPGQMTAMASLYKLARVEKVEFHFKFTNLGPSAILGNADAPTATAQSMASGSVNHLLVTLPQSQFTDTFSRPGLTNTPKWLPGSFHSDSNSAQMAELPGSTVVTSSQDGNREIVHVRKSYDCASKQAGDPIRTATWMVSNDLGTAWTIPAAAPEDPILGVIGTSSLIDNTLIALPDSGTLVESQRNIWFRYNEHVHVRYHITFWEPKTPQITFT